MGAIKSRGSVTRVTGSWPGQAPSNRASSPDQNVSERLHTGHEKWPLTARLELGKPLISQAAGPNNTMVISTLNNRTRAIGHERR